MMPSSAECAQGHTCIYTISLNSSSVLDAPAVTVSIPRHRSHSIFGRGGGKLIPALPTVAPMLLPTTTSESFRREKKRARGEKEVVGIFIKEGEGR